MNDDARQSLAAWLFDLGAIPAGALVFSIACTAWLVAGRIRGCFHFRQPTPIRDVALLITSPVCAILICIIEAAAGALGFFVHDFLHPDAVLAANLRAAIGVCLVAIVCFVASVISLLLPAKSNANVA